MAYQAKRSSAALTCLAVLGISQAGCGGGLVKVPRGQHPLDSGATPVVVDVAPPPARIDTIANERPPEAGCAWADGRWQWTDNRWVWQPGSWVRVPDGCYYADSLIVWVPSIQGGALFYTSGQWYSKNEGKPCRTPASCG